MKEIYYRKRVVTKLVLVFMAMLIGITIMTTLVGCGNNHYDQDSYTIEFSEKEAVFTIPKDAELFVYKQTKNFVKQNIDPIREKRIGGLLQYVFDNKDYSIMTYKIVRVNNIDRAGFFQQSGNFTIKANLKQDKYTIKEYSGKLPNGLAGIEDCMLTNVGNNYFKILKAGETFDLRLWRNSMIVNDFTSNIQIEPTFDYEIINKNAENNILIERSGDSNFTITGINGVTQVKFTYQAIQVLNNDSWFLYNACDRNREVVITFATGDSYTNDITSQINGKEFDSEFDSIYFTGDSGMASLYTDADNVKCNGEEVTSNANNYTLTINIGSNIVELIKNGKSKFFTIYGAKIDIIIEKSAENIKAGDKITIKINGVYTALPKVSGVYNPAQKYPMGNPPTNGSSLLLIEDNGEEIKAEYVSQYYIGANNTFEIIVKDEYLTNGKLNFKIKYYAEWWGGEAGFHRLITKNGVDTNLNADLHNSYFGYFENIEI
ncbi:MAG: hypothetical protein K2P12_01730 [Clostridia bacterium]|nr:hypothetical protein [Clostridia bacterium]